MDRVVYMRKGNIGILQQCDCRSRNSLELVLQSEVPTAINLFVHTVCVLIIF